jgi:3-hydroxybutyryl-CoA dehydratase
MTMHNFKVGDTASFSKTITEADIVAFAEISGDHNPLHLDAVFAATSRFGQRIAHGALVSSLISNVIGNQLPGEGSIYLSSSLKFRAPTFIDDTITATATISSIREDKPIFVLACVCNNQNSKVVCEGESVILYEP